MFYDSKLSGRPNCYCCYKDALKSKKKGNSKSRVRRKLEQVRFVLVSHIGDIEDIDWPKWITAQRLKNEEVEGNLGGKYVLGQDNCCSKPSLKYIRSTKLSDLVGITIQCESCSNKRTLGGFFNLRKRKGTITDSQKKSYPVNFKPLIRTSNSVYYPIIMNSLFIPQPENKLSHTDTLTIRNAWSRGVSPGDIAVTLKYDLKDVSQVLGEGKFLTEMEFRKNEYEYLLNRDNHNLENRDLVVEEIIINNDLKSCGFERIIKIKRLKLTSVQTGYTRLSPMDRDVFLSKEDKTIQFDNIKVPLKPKYTVTNHAETEFLAGVESFGEGIFLKWDDKMIDCFISEYLRNEKTKSKIQTLWDRVQINEMIDKKKFKDLTHLTKFLLIHSFSHIIIKELEFICGYPSSSVAERIYCDTDNMSGLLIYTIAGSEGSFGGLIKQSENFKNLLLSALLRARDCNSDPICFESDGQGIGGFNFAACYSCLLISEISCEGFNSFLDRGILIDENNGFLKGWKE
ncbi:MAG: DUF1998 domain-containing protein [Candidatus Omnitrophica bacterium]|nr:DUF1998 domain-containing protein [Candidatus Omnitrophota bacterium]